MTVLENQKDQWLDRDLKAFLKWLKQTHPEIHDVYYDNFSIPFKGNGGFTVNNSNKISEEEHKKLVTIANEFYKAH